MTRCGGRWYSTSTQIVGYGRRHLGATLRHRAVGPSRHGRSSLDPIGCPKPAVRDRLKGVRKRPLSRREQIGWPLRAVQLLLGHTKLESTVRYLGIEVNDALEMAEQTEV